MTDFFFFLTIALFFVVLNTFVTESIKGFERVKNSQESLSLNRAKNIKLLKQFYPLKLSQYLP
jgi:hypothetical protein